MKLLDSLKKQAKDAAEFRGHNLARFGFTVRMGNIRGGYRCLKCGMLAHVDTNPPANGIRVGGDAVAMNCKS